jgi:hypothetical protein
MISKRLSFAAIAAFCAISSWVSAATIVDFKPNPVSPTTPEFQFSRALNGGGAPVFRGALGSTSNSDGNLPILGQTSPGLDSETPFLLIGFPGSANDFAAGTTHFYDSSLQFTAGLVANAPAINAGGVLVQQLSPGSFELRSTAPASILLLSGNMSAASFVVGVGNAGSAFSSQDVNYTGGIIFNALLASGGTVNGNSMSISMNDVAPNLNIAGDGFLGDFNANATGLFNVNAVPEPTSLTLLAIALGTLIFRRR